jgi:hypothetical protein
MSVPGPCPRGAAGGLPATVFIRKQADRRPSNPRPPTSKIKLRNLLRRCARVIPFPAFASGSVRAGSAAAPANSSLPESSFWCLPFCMGRRRRSTTCKAFAATTDAADGTKAVHILFTDGIHTLTAEGPEGDREFFYQNRARAGERRLARPGYAVRAGVRLGEPVLLRAAGRGGVRPRADGAAGGAGTADAAGADRLGLLLPAGRLALAGARPRRPLHRTACARKGGGRHRQSPPCSSQRRVVRRARSRGWWLRPSLRALWSPLRTPRGP